MTATVRPGGLTAGWNDGDAYGAAMNANLDRLDATVQLAVIHNGTNAPPGSPADGDRYIIGLSPSGAWTGHAAAVAVYDARVPGWAFYAPRTGWLAWATDESKLYVYQSTAWSAFTIGAGGQDKVTLFAEQFQGSDPAAFGQGVLGAVDNTTAFALSMIGTSPRASSATFRVPRDWSTLSEIDIYHANSGTSSAAWVLQVGFRKRAQGGDLRVAATMSPKLTIVPASQFITSLALPSLPAVPLVPGEVIDFVLLRLSSDSLDINADAMLIHSVDIFYNRV